MRLLVACDHLALTGGLLRFARVGRVLARGGHELVFAALGAPDDRRFRTELRVLSLAEAARETWDAAMVPGGGFPDATIAAFAGLRDPRFGLRVQHFLNGPPRAEAYARVAAAFAPDLVIVNNAHWDDTCLDALGRPWRRLVGAVDPALFAPPVLRPPRRGPLRLGALASKHPGAHLAALGRLGPGWALHWFGRADPALLAAHADLVRAGRLVSHGVLAEEDLPPWYHGLDAFVSAEAHAGWCNPAAEATACGTPLVTTAHGTLAFADPGTAAMLPDAAEADLGARIAEAAAAIAADPEGAARRAAAGRERIRRLDWNAYADALLAVLREAGAGGPPPEIDAAPPPDEAARIAGLARDQGALPDDFDAAGYVRLHPDLKALFPHAWQGALHYLEHGRREGRLYPSSRTRAQEKLEQAPRIVVALDGLDGSGKSSVARIVAAATGATVLNPFNGSVGGVLVHLARTGRHDLADAVAHAAVAAAMAAVPAGPVVFDRHWFTASQLLSASYRAGWEPRPFSVMCWADRPTTIARMVARGVPDPGAQMTEERIATYRTLAADLSLPLLDTSYISPEEAARRVLAMLAERCVP